jgi:two-component system, NarL family, nitrate/nitrite response regulator NarL
MKEKINILIVDDHRIVIDGLKALLEDNPTFNIVATTTNSTEVLGLLATNQVHVLLTDVMMPLMTGQELAKQVRSHYPTIKILALSMSGQGDVVNEMINDADINGYVLKNISKPELSTAIIKIANGGIFFSEEVLQELEKTSQVKKENDDAQLTTREIEILRLIEKEQSNKAIADQLFISERTVETHRKNIFRKTKTNGVLGLIKYAYQHKLI